MTCLCFAGVLEGTGLGKRTTTIENILKKP